MRKTVFFLIMLVILFGCFTANAMSVEITQVRGGYGVIATVANASSYQWMIGIEGPHLFNGTSITRGDTITTNNKITIRTPIFPPVFGIGRINITVAIVSGMTPVALEMRTAFMLGPFVLSMQE
jgi:hypothetical protein